MSIQETQDILDPDLPICDAHHHLWDRPGSRYLLDEFLADVEGGHRIQSTVYIDCGSMYRQNGSPKLAPVGETEFADGIAVQSGQRPGLPGLCAGIVGFADLNLGHEVAEVLDAHIAVSSRFKGIRHCAAWDPSDRIVNAHTNPFQHMMASASFRQGFSELAKRNLSFDAWVFHPQIPEVKDLAHAFPGTTIVLDHMGGPLGIGPYAGQRQEVFAAWKISMEKLAECPNVAVKLGGIQMPLNGWGLHKQPSPPDSGQIVALTREFYLHAIDCFGVRRCMFESNYPADKPSVPYNTLWNAFKRMTLGFSPGDRSALFHDNAARIYRLEPTAVKTDQSTATDG